MAALSGAGMKFLADDLPILQIIWFRFAGFFAIILPIAMWRFGAGALRPKRPGLQLIRGVLLPLSTGLFVLGATTLDYADAIAVLYVYPFIITLIGPFLLGERTRLAALIGVAGGFAGVLLIMRPSVDGLQNPGTIWVVLCGLSVALQMVLNRRLGRDVDPLLTSTWGALAAVLLLTPMLAFVWTPIAMEQLGLLLVLAILAAGSQTLFAIAFARAAASELAPFTYCEIIAAVVIGFVVFDTLPGLVSWIGIAIIIVSGVMVARSQNGGRFMRRQTKI